MPAIARYCKLAESTFCLKTCLLNFENIVDQRATRRHQSKIFEFCRQLKCSFLSCHRRISRVSRDEPSIRRSNPILQLWIGPWCILM